MAIDTSAAAGLPGVAGFMAAADIKGSNRLALAPVNDRPVLCDDRVRVIGDPVLVVAADTRDHALAAAAAVRVEYELLPVLESPAQAMAEGALQLHDDLPNVCLTQGTVRGDAASALAGSATVVEAEYHTQINHQAPLEPEVSVAYLEGEGDDAQLVVVGRSINIHKALSMLQDALGWDDIRYEEAFTGGQFGIKVEITTEAIAGAAALHFQRPVRYIPGLTDTLLLTPKRHPFDIDRAPGRRRRRPADRVGDGRGHRQRRLLLERPGGRAALDHDALGLLPYPQRRCPCSSWCTPTTPGERPRGAPGRRR